MSAIRFPGERYQVVPVCDHHGRHVEGKGMPLAPVPAEPDPEPEPELATAAAPAPEPEAARPAPIKRVSKR